MTATLGTRAFRYAIAGVVATLIYFVAVAALVELAHVSPAVAAVVATIVVMITSYVINRAFVFDTTRTHTSAFTRFALATLVSVALNAGLMQLATRVFGWPYLVGAALTVLVVPPTNFAINYLWTFRAPD